MPHSLGHGTLATRSFTNSCLAARICTMPAASETLAHPPLAALCTGNLAPLGCWACQRSWLLPKLLSAFFSLHHHRRAFCLVTGVLLLSFSCTHSPGSHANARTPEKPQKSTYCAPSREATSLGLPPRIRVVSMQREGEAATQPATLVRVRLCLELGHVCF